MDATGNLDMTADRDLAKLEAQPEVYAYSDRPFESPAETFVPGPYYREISEVAPDLAEADAAPSTDRPALAVDRRELLRLFGMGTMVASAACVRRPVEYAIPYVDQPIDQIPGVAVYYATTCPEGNGIVVKTREGRPVKVEGNSEHPLSQGAASIRAQAALQALYHPDRHTSPSIRYGAKSAEVSWDDVYQKLGRRVKESKNIAILAGPSTGSRDSFYRAFLGKVGAKPENLFIVNSNHLVSAATMAHQLAFGIEGLPRTDIRRSQLLVGIGADFLDTGVSQVYESKSWSDSHSFRLNNKGKLVQFESRLTQTGAKADERYPIAPGDELAVTLLLVKALLENGVARGSKEEQNEIRKIVEAQAAFAEETRTRLNLAPEVFSQLAQELLAKESLVMVGGSSAHDENATLTQLAGIMANVLIGAYGKTLNFDKGWFTSAGAPDGLSRFMNAAKDIDLLFVIDSNPAFTLPKSSGIDAALKGIKSVVSIQSMPTETDAYAEFVLNSHHYLETWGDEQSVAGFWSLRQPVVRPLTNSRQAEDILLWTLAAMEQPLTPFSEYRDYLRERWKAVFLLVEAKVDFDTFFKAVQRRGFVGRLEKRTQTTLRDLSQAFASVKAPARGLKLVAHLDSRLFDGSVAQLPVLQEVPDAITTVCWDTWVGLNPNKMKELGIRYNDVLKVEGPGGSFEGSAYPIPGLHPETVAVPRGNGRHKEVSRVSDGVGFDPQDALGLAVDSLTKVPVSSGQVVTLSKVGRVYRLAAQQKSSDIGNRLDIIKTVSLESAIANAEKQKDLDEVPDLYPALPVMDYRWGMAIDLDKCTGCGACMVACATENNIPQVGREQVLLGREMHWIRLDRYFKGSLDNPEVTFQPVGCQHCNHAPCEAVCPVFATTHDAEGMNSQTYNRCVGTRYCANACPYKVRRFNWWTHKWNVIGDRPVDRNPRAMNPDVTVRTRGIMEKCTFCVQRIRDAKHVAKERGNKVADGEIRTACQQGCTTNAITFGDLSDPKSRVAGMRKDNRAYLMLGGDPEHGHYGIKTLPNVSYLAKVSRKEQAAPEHGTKENHHG